MAGTYMLRKRQAELSALTRPEAQARINAEIEASKRAASDLRDQFPVITPDNFDAAATFLRTRLNFWKAEQTAPVGRTALLEEG